MHHPILSICPGFTAGSLSSRIPKFIVHASASMLLILLRHVAAHDCAKARVDRHCSSVRVNAPVLWRFGGPETD